MLIKRGMVIFDLRPKIGQKGPRGAISDNAYNTVDIWYNYIMWHMVLPYFCLHETVETIKNSFGAPGRIYGPPDPKIFKKQQKLVNFIKNLGIRIISLTKSTQLSIENQL